MCAHCRPPTPDHEPPIPPGPTGRWFHAVHLGTCAACRTAYATGTPIRMYLPAGWIANCCDTPTW